MFMSYRRHVFAQALPVLALVWLAFCPLAVAAPDAPQSAAPRRIAVTVDDLPVTPAGLHSVEQQAQITRRLLATLTTHGVPAVGFVNEAKLDGDGRRDPRLVGLLELWLEAGQELGNHGFAHLDLHAVDVGAWEADVLRGERVIRPLIEAHGGRLRWFRHPYLHVGRSVDVQHRSTEFLDRHGYEVAPVTVDSGEWVYGRAYADAWNRADRALMRTLGEDYIRYMLAVVEFYEGQARTIVGREIPQVLLVHASALNADWLGRLLSELEGRGYAWIPLERALADPAYSRPIDGYTGPGGITWLHRWAITAGVDRTIFRGEPEVPEWVSRTRRDGASRSPVRTPEESGGHEPGGGPEGG